MSCYIHVSVSDKTIRFDLNSFAHTSIVEVYTVIKVISRAGLGVGKLPKEQLVPSCTLSFTYTVQAENNLHLKKKLLFEKCFHILH